MRALRAYLSSTEAPADDDQPLFGSRGFVIRTIFHHTGHQVHDLRAGGDSAAKAGANGTDNSLAREAVGTWAHSGGTERLYDHNTATLGITTAIAKAALMDVEFEPVSTTAARRGARPRR